MIIASWDIQPIGQRQTADWDRIGPDGNIVTFRRVPYIPIREATHEEWLRWASENARQQGREFPLDHERCNYYYEISMD